MSNGVSNPEEARPDQLSDPDRKLWFDYLSRLTDRRSQESKESGATTWVLLGVAVAILYKAVPSIPDVSSIPGMVRTIFLMLLLELNAAFCLVVLVAGLASYAFGSTETRLIPRSTERLHKLSSAIVLGLEFVVGIVQIVVGRTVTGASWVKCTLLVFGGFYLLNACYSVIKKIKTARVSKSRGAPPPRFHVSTLAYPIPTMCIHLLLGALAFVGMGQYLKLLGQTAPGWLVPLSASTYALAFFGILAILLGRTLDAASQHAYQSLERAILVENLSAAEIRSRFVEQLLGSGVRDWLREITNGLKSEEETLERTVESIKKRVPEIEAIDAGNVGERELKGKELARQLVAAIEKRKASIQRYQFQLAEYFGSGHSGSETDFLKVMNAELSEWLQRVKVRASNTAAVLAEIQALSIPSSTEAAGPTTLAQIESVSAPIVLQRKENS